MPHGAKTYLAAALAVASGQRIVWIARDAEIADRVAEELAAWLGDPDAVVTLEPRTALAYERSELVRDESAARVAALAAWRRPSTARPRVLVASVQALFQRTLATGAHPPERRSCLRRGLRLVAGAGARTLVDARLRDVPEVGGRGEFARRGGIVDVFPAGQPLPVRVEWFGDEIESLRAFDPADQRGRRSGRAEATLLPASEFLLGPRCRAPTSAERLGRPPPACRSASRPTWRASRPASLGDAAEVWAGHLAPATALDHLGDAHLAHRRARRGRRRGRLPVDPGRRATHRAGARRRAAEGVARQPTRSRATGSAACSRLARSS